MAALHDLSGLAGALLATSLLVAAPSAAVVAAQASPPAEMAGPVHSDPVLTLDEALAVARGEQPGVAAFERDAIASEQAAIAARSLPDPEVSVGIQNFPIRGDNAFSPTDDEMTMYTIGVMREQVRRSRREAEASRLQAEAVVSRAEGTARQRKIQRDVMIAWLGAVEAAARQRLLAQVVSDLQTGLKVIEAGVPTGASSPALALEAQAEVALAEAQASAARGDEVRARAELGRWIGPAAQRPLPDRVPSLALPSQASEASAFATHPEILAARAKEEAAERQTDVARAERRPSVSWSAMIGFRPRYGEMVSAQVSIPLQINRRGLQNRRIAEAQARADAARLRTLDAARELGGTYGAALADYRKADAQIALLRDKAIPSLDASFKAAEARYAGGQGTLELPLNIVRRYVEANVQLVEQQGARARAAAELLYLTGEQPR
ncbi:MAG: TolC family protein [Pseudomonadota bacterium]|nr:TolC family protein [Pseudomonadota bacterium]